MTSVKKLIESLVREVLAEQQYDNRAAEIMYKIELVGSKFNKVGFSLPVEYYAKEIGISPEEIAQAIKSSIKNNGWDDYNMYIDYDDDTKQVYYGDPMDV